jgi:8-oxo-dGTP pyrophosphatase MutT (NUDIX family)
MIAESKLHSMVESMSPLRRLRRSARIFLFDECGDILLIRFVAQREDGPFVFWVTPGGEVEPGEDDRAAAIRELQEELGLTLTLIGPVHQESGGMYTHLGETVRNFDVFFAARCKRDQPRLAGVTADEIALMQEARWWTVAELAVTAERIFPADLGQIAARTLAEVFPNKSSSGATGVLAQGGLLAKIEV